MALVSTALVASAAGSAPGVWAKAPSLPSPRSAHAVVVAAGAIHVLGGPGARNVDRFDGRRWSHETQLPRGVLNAPAAVALGRKVYLIGGFSGESNIPTGEVWVFDASSKGWSDVAPLPEPRGGHAAVVLDGRIHVLGGGSDVSTLATHWVYDPATDTWSKAAPLPRAEGSPRPSSSAARSTRSEAGAGSTTTATPTSTTRRSGHWMRGPSLPPRGTVGAVVWRGSIYVFAGESQAKGSVLADVYRRAPGAKRWQRIGRMPTARNYARSVVYHRKIYVVGGSTVAGIRRPAVGSSRRSFRADPRDGGDRRGTRRVEFVRGMKPPAET